LNASTGDWTLRWHQNPDTELEPTYTGASKGTQKYWVLAVSSGASRRTCGRSSSAGLTGADSGLGSGWDIFWTSAGLWAGTVGAEVNGDPAIRLDHPRPFLHSHQPACPRRGLDNTGSLYGTTSPLVLEFSALAQCMGR